MKPFRDKLEEGPLLFDGAIGTMLYERGVFLTRCFEEVCISNPALVQQIHEEYTQAGAQVLTTNSFGANRMRLEKHGLVGKLREINTEAVKLARVAAQGRAYVAGSVGPTGLTLEALVGRDGELAERALSEQMSILLEEGADLLCLETFTVLQELEFALRIARRITDAPVVAQFTFGRNQRGLAGQTPALVAKRLIEAGADVIGANCGGAPDLIFAVASPMVGHGKPVLAQANAGRPETFDGRTIYVANPEYFGVFARRLLKAGIRAIGGCCGTNPDHIRRMSGAVRMMSADAGHPTPRIEGMSGLADGGSSEGNADGETIGGLDGPDLREIAEWSELGRQIADGEFAVSVEINPPLGFDLGKKIAAAAKLREFGVTTINIADGPRASLRMSNLSMATRILQETGLSPIVHVCCRDRNLLGLQSHLLGAHVLGLRNLVVITGDPPKMGDYPDSTAVYDVDSVGLLHILHGYNHGFDPAGKEMPAPTRFVLGTGAEPAAIDYDRELRRLELKRDAGAHFVMTQPVYDPYKFERFLDDTAEFGLPILVGLCPLASYRNAMFLHGNIPGMQIPDYIRERVRVADEAGRGREEGILIAREALEAVRDRVQGAYIMPPFGRHKAAMNVLDGFLDRDRSVAAGARDPQEHTSGEPQPAEGGQ